MRHQNVEKLTFFVRNVHFLSVQFAICIFYEIYLHNSKKSCNFAAEYV